MDSTAPVTQLHQLGSRRIGQILRVGRKQLGEHDGLNESCIGFVELADFQEVHAQPHVGEHPPNRIRLSLTLPEGERLPQTNLHLGTKVVVLKRLSGNAPGVSQPR